MFTYYLHITNCGDEGFLDKLYELVENKEEFITIVTTPPNPHLFGFFTIFNTTSTYPELTNFFKEKFQERNSWILIDISSTKVCFNQPKDYSDKLSNLIPQSSLIVDEVDLTTLSDERLLKLIDSYIEKEDFIKCDEIHRIIKSRENV